MKLSSYFLLALAAASFSFPAVAKEMPSVSAAVPQLEAATSLLKANDPAGAIKILDEIIAANERRHGKTKVYCSRSQVETIAYMAEAAAAKMSAIAVAPDYCDSVFLKGYALVDLKRPAEARTWLERAVSMAPHHAWYKAELAEGYKVEREWDKAYALFAQAADDARAFTPDDSKTIELGRALRGMGFTQIEKGALDDAERLFNEALKLNPNDKGAKGELDYIKELRATQKRIS